MRARGSSVSRASAAAAFSDGLRPNVSRRSRGLFDDAAARIAAVCADPLARRVASTAFLLLCLRAAQFVPLPGFAHAPASAAGGNVVNLLLPSDLGDTAGAGVGVCHMGISPYLTASFALSFALSFSPELRKWRKEAETDVISQLARRLGLGCSLLQALWTALALRPCASPLFLALPLPNYLFVTALPLAAGTSCLMWLAEEITRTGIGQGSSVAISLSIVGGYASALRTFIPSLLAGALPAAGVAAVLAAVFAQTALAVLVTEGVRRVPIAFFQLQGGAGGGRATPLGNDHIPFRCNPTGIQPILFALLLLEGLPWVLGAAGAPAALRAALADALSPAGPLLYIACFALVFAASFLDVEDTPKEVAEYILKVGARVPGVRPGDATVAYLRETQAGARFWGGLLLGLLSTGSLAVDKWMHAAYGRSIGFTSLLIIVRRPLPRAVVLLTPSHPSQAGTVLQMRRQVRAFTEKPRLAATLASL